MTLVLVEGPSGSPENHAYLRLMSLALVGRGHTPYIPALDTSPTAVQKALADACQTVVFPLDRGWGLAAASAHQRAISAGKTCLYATLGTLYDQESWVSTLASWTKHLARSQQADWLLTQLGSVLDLKTSGVSPEVH